MILRVEIDGKKMDVQRSRYVAAKTKQLREFGYTSLLQSEVNEQLDAVLAGKTLDDGLTVIGAFMRDEVKGKSHL